MGQSSWIDRMPRYSISHLLLVTTVIAGGIAVPSLMGTRGFSGFCLGVFATLVVAGLVQQLIWPPSQDSGPDSRPFARRVCLVVILVIFFIAVYFHRHPVELSPQQASRFAMEQGDLIHYELAEPLAIFCLFLGTLTAASPVRITAVEPSSRRRSAKRLSIGVLLVCLFIYLCVLTHQAAYVPWMVDQALNATKMGISQGPASGTEGYVDWFARTPEQLGQMRRFQVIQLLSWPPLVLATVAVIGSANRRASPALKRKLMLIAMLGVTPAIANLIWCLGGAASAVYPEFVNSFWLQPRFDLLLAPFAIVLVALYFVSRSGESQVEQLQSEKLQSEQLQGIGESRPAESDQVGSFYLVDHLLVSLSLAGWAFVETYAWFEMQVTFRGSMWERETWSGRIAWIFELVEFCFSNPAFSLPIFSLFYAVVCLRRWWVVGRFPSTRWPDVASESLVLLPVVAFLLTLCLVLALPFGLATISMVNGWG